MTRAAPPTDQQLQDAIVRLLRQRAPGTTACPSEVARAVAPAHWRPLMPRIRDAARTLAAEGQVEIRQRGQAVALDAPLRGPIRLALLSAGAEIPPA